MSTATRCMRWGQVAVMLLVCLFLSACQSKVTKENYDKIKVGMTLKEVEAILGEGTEEGGDGSGRTAVVGVDAGAGKVPPSHVWRSGDKEIRLYFTNGKVSNKTDKGL